MKFLLGCLVSVGVLTFQVEAEDKQSLKNQHEKTSYSVGMNVGNTWKNRGITDLNLDLVMQGIKDVLSGNQPLLTDEEMNATLTAYQTELRARVDEKRRKEGEKNKILGDNFLAENKKKPGVVVLPSGLQYKVLTAGNGPTPQTNHSVSVHYKGALIDGTEFDSSLKRGQPANFPVTGVIKGWTEALLLMKVGSKWQLFIPPDLGYGEYGSGSKISPNATLIFEVELLSTTPPAEPQPVTSDIIKVPSAEELKKGAKIEVIKPDQIPKK